MKQLHDTGIASLIISTSSDTAQIDRTMNLLVDVFEPQFDSFDRVFTLVFETLGMQTIAIRICPSTTLFPPRSYIC
jgi:hypothetical protein